MPSARAPSTWQSLESVPDARRGCAGLAADQLVLHRATGIDRG